MIFTHPRVVSNQYDLTDLSGTLTRFSWPLAANTASAHTPMRYQPKHLRHVGPFLSLAFLNTAVQEQAQHIIKQKSSISQQRLLM